MLKVDINLVFAIINVLLFFILIRIFLFKPILNIIEKRKQMVGDEFLKAEQANEEALQLKSEYEASLADAKQESIQIIETARSRGEAEYNRIVAEAAEQSESMLNTAKANIARQQEQAMADVQGEITDLTLAAVAKIIGEAGSDQINSDLYDEFLAKAGTK